MQSQARLEQVERVTGPVLTVLALALIPILLLPLVMDLPGPAHRVLDAADIAIWVTFAGVLAVKLVFAPDRLRYLRRHWVEVVLVVLPFARPLRLLRAARVLAVVGLNGRVVRELLDGRGTRTALAVVAGTVVTAGTLMWLIERRRGDANIERPLDGMWWALTTVTTVGYGDYYPTTPAGRVIAAIVMFVGIAALSAVTAAIAAIMVRESKDEQVNPVLLKLEQLEVEVRLLREQVARGAPQTELVGDSAPREEPPKRP
ncbi:MAG: potassium channel family protein [Dehalococcoidia bacterium]